MPNRDNRPGAGGAGGGEEGETIHSGFTLTYQLLARRQSIPLIVITGSRPSAFQRTRKARGDEGKRRGEKYKCQWKEGLRKRTATPFCHRLSEKEGRTADNMLSKTFCPNQTPWPVIKFKGASYLSLSRLPRSACKHPSLSADVIGSAATETHKQRDDPPK